MIAFPIYGDFLANTFFTIILNTKNIHIISIIPIIGLKLPILYFVFSSIFNPISYFRLSPFRSRPLTENSPSCRLKVLVVHQGAYDGPVKYGATLY